MTVTRTKMDFADLSVGWEAEARQWIQWARTPGHDSYWRFHRDQFLRLLPPPGRQTLDIGCGEGRLARDLKELGHRIVGIDSSPSLVAAAREFDPSMDVRLADAAALPLDDACADLAVAFMSLQDIDGMPAVIQEAARVLEPGGRARECWPPRPDCLLLLGAMARTEVRASGIRRRTFQTFKRSSNKGDRTSRIKIGRASCRERV